MDQVRLGNTELIVGVAGLGCGGFSKLGTGSGSAPDEPIKLVRRAVELGVTFFDTAPSYETEAIVGKAVAGIRDSVVISTKVSPVNPDGNLIDVVTMRNSLQQSLALLQTDYIDVYSLHSPTARDYDHCRSELLPALLGLQAEGLIRVIGMTEPYIDDPAHELSRLAVDDACWNYFLIGFNLLNPSAARYVLPSAAERGIGIAIMFAVRSALADRDGLRQLISKLVEQGRLDGSEIDLDDPLGFLVSDGSCSSIVEAAYRFCRHEASNAVVLTGTGSIKHLEENIRSINLGPLATEHRRRLQAIFGNIDSLTGQEVVDEFGKIGNKKKLTGSSRRR